MMLKNSVVTILILLACYLLNALAAIDAIAESAETPLVRIFTDDFSRGDGNWEVMQGEWEIKDGKYFVSHKSGGDAISHAYVAPNLNVQIVEAKMVVKERLNPQAWSFSGINIFLDANNFWMLALTEGPNEERYIDFLKNYQGRWRAETKLEVSIDENMHLRWEYNKKYKLRLQLDEEGIAGLVIDYSTNKVLSTRRYEFGEALTLKLGKAGLVARYCAAYFDNVSVTGPTIKEVTALKKIEIEEGKEGRIAILKDKLPGLDFSAVDHIASALRSEGFGVTFISGEDASEPDILNANNFFLYIIPNARVYPAKATPALMRYVRNKGNLMVLGGPAFKEVAWKQGEEWITGELYAQMIAKVKPDNIFLDFDDMNNLSDWIRHTNDTNIPAGIEIDEGGPKGSKQCMRYWTKNLTGWNTYSSPPREDIFLEGHSLLCFWAKGGDRTPQLMIELNESDGSRWIATVNLTTEWKYYVLSPEDFRYWEDSPTKDRRGGPGDRFNPEEAVKIDFGLAFTHTLAVGGGPHEFWVDEVGSAVNPFGELKIEKPGMPLVMETITPSYRVYPLTHIASLEVEQNRSIIGKDLNLAVPSSGISPIRRPQGAGFGNNRKWRWIPLINALDKKGEERGTIAWMLINYVAPHRGAVFASFGFNDQSLLKDKNWSLVLVEVARRIKEGVFLYEAGSRYFSYWPDEKVNLGAQVLNVGERDASVTVRLQIIPAGKADIVFREEAIASLKPGESKKVEFEWAPEKFAHDLYFVKTELLRDGKLIDVISHEMGILCVRKPAPDEFVTIKGSNFYLKGEKWNPMGINFWPLYISGIQSGDVDYYLGWLDPSFYDPEEIERDFRRMAALGINMVSIQFSARHIRTLLDFLRRCERHNIKVNLFMGHSPMEFASPLAFNEKVVSEFIRVTRMNDNPTVFAFDIVWEPSNHVFAPGRRDRWNRDWEKWIIERYKSIENAEDDWDFPVPRSAEGRITSPSCKQMQEQGEWRVMVAAYRRFMDDLMSKKWNVATRKLSKIAPHHLISFRQGNTLPYDFTLTATPKHIDFISPGGYNFPLGEDGFNASCFVIRYVNFVTRGKPILWSEFGKSVWDGHVMEPNPGVIKAQGEFHAQFYRMVLEAGANGITPWWWPGGYRVKERSDFGIINPDGTFRPAAEQLRKYAPLIKAPRSFPEPNYWITIDRDAHPGGYWHMTFNEGQEAFGRARAKGKNLGIRTRGTGTNSANTPLVAVGNTRYNGKNPPKYLNAEFNWFEIKNANGEWLEVKDGSEIEVKKNAVVLAKVSVGNLQEAEWLPPESTKGEPGAVYLASPGESELKFKKAIPKNTPYLKDADFGEFTLNSGISERTTVVLRMTAEGRAWFGEKLDFTLVPE
ncbi:MAG: hypothetical protein DDT31_00904 [Syntrophomonadaceae bacterium]|nr:hypothetical protein [Bacillota bacterium]